MRDLVRAQDKRIVQLLKTVSDLHQRLDKAGIGSSALESEVAPEADSSSPMGSRSSRRSSEKQTRDRI